MCSKESDLYYVNSAYTLKVHTLALCQEAKSLNKKMSESLGQLRMSEDIWNSEDEGICSSGLGERNPLLVDSDSFVMDEILYSSTPLPEIPKSTEPSSGYTLDEAIDKLGFGFFQMMAFFFCGLIWLTGAMNVMSISILSAAVKCQWSLSGTEQALISILTFLGYFFGYIFWGYVGDSFGRKIVLAGMNLVLLIFGVVGALKLSSDDTRLPGYPWLLLCRFGVGFGASGIGQATTFFMDFLPKRLQPICSVYLTSWWGVGTTFGAFLAAVIMGDRHLSWHWYTGILATPSLLVISLLPFVSESPMQHLSKGKLGKAEKVLRIMARLNLREMPTGELSSLDSSDLTSIEQSRTASRHILSKCYLLSYLKPLYGKLSVLLANGMWKTSVPVGFLWFAASWIYFGGVLLSVNVLQEKPQCKKYRLDWISSASFINNNTSAGSAFNSNAFTGTLRSCEYDYLDTRDYLNLMWISGAEIPDILLTTLLARVIGRRLSVSVNLAMAMLGFSLLFLCTTEKTLTIYLIIIRIFTSAFYKAMYAYTPGIYPQGSRGLGISFSTSMSHFGAILTPFFAQALFSASFLATVTIYAGLCLILVFVALLLPIESNKRLLRP